MTIEQLLKPKLQSDILNAVNNKFNVIVTNDISLYASGRNAPKGNELYVIIQTGNGIRSVSESGGYITQPLQIYFYAPQNNLQEVLTVLTDYASRESAEGNVQTLDSENVQYKFFVNYNTPTTDGITFKLSEKTYITILLTGNMLYSDIDLGIGSSLDYEINGVPLKNIISESSDTITLNENVLYEGKTEISNLINAISNTLNLSILYDKNNVLHKELKKLSYYISNINDINKTITLKDSELSLEISYNAIITVKRDGNPNGFTLLTLNIQRSD